jgi:hypothetical protein
MIDVLESLAGSKIFSPLDMLKGFHQKAVDEETIPKLTIASPWGSFSYKVMPFRCVNGPSTYARALCFAIQPFIGDFGTAYLDKIILFISKKF